MFFSGSPLGCRCLLHKAFSVFMNVVWIMNAAWVCRRMLLQRFQGYGNPTSPCYLLYGGPVTDSDKYCHCLSMSFTTLGNYDSSKGHKGNPSRVVNVFADLQTSVFAVDFLEKVCDMSVSLKTAICKNAKKLCRFPLIQSKFHCVQFCCDVTEQANNEMDFELFSVWASAVEKTH